MIVIDGDESALRYYSALNQARLCIIDISKNFQYLPYLGWFSQDIQKHIQSYYHNRDKLTAFTSQLLQRHFLPLINGIPHSAFLLEYTRHKKPYIVNPQYTDINFNISHSNSYVAMAYIKSNHFSIGVDIEKINYATSDIAELSQIVFSPSEQKLVEGKIENFYKLWTKKEALIKACGTGFATDFYQTTTINLEDMEINKNYLIYVQEFNGYFLSICLYPK